MVIHIFFLRRSCTDARGRWWGGVAKSSPSPSPFLATSPPLETERLASREGSKRGKQPQGRSSSAREAERHVSSAGTGGRSSWCGGSTPPWRWICPPPPPPGTRSGEGGFEGSGWHEESIVVAGGWGCKTWLMMEKEDGTSNGCTTRSAARLAHLMAAEASVGDNRDAVVACECEMQPGRWQGGRHSL